MNAIPCCVRECQYREHYQPNRPSCFGSNSLLTSKHAADCPKINKQDHRYGNSEVTSDMAKPSRRYDVRQGPLLTVQTFHAH